MFFTIGTNLCTTASTSITITFTSASSTSNTISTNTGWQVAPLPKPKPKPKPRFKKGDVVRIESSGILNNRVGKIGGYMPTKEFVCLVEWPDGGWTGFAETALKLIPPKKAQKRPKHRGSVPFLQP